jgi:HSP20 family protein
LTTIFKSPTIYKHKTFCGIIFRRETQRFRAKKANKRRCLIAKLSGGALSLLQPKPQVAAEIIILQKVYSASTLLKKNMFKNLFPFSAKGGSASGGKKEDEESFFPIQKNDGEDHTWLAKDYEGELSIDVYQTEKEIVVRSTMAGVRPEDLNIIVNNDLLTIRGKRETEPNINPSDYLYRECFWGGFSRTIVLPQDIKVNKIKATLKNGLLTIILPKAILNAQIKVREEF